MGGLRLYALVFTAGFCSLGVELTAARLLAPFFGTSTLVWANVIGLTLLVPTLAIGFWPRLAIDFYQASTDALSGELGQLGSLALSHLQSVG